MGKLLFAAAVLAIPLYDFYYAIKQYRRISTHLATGRLSLNSAVTLWNDSVTQCMQWRDQAIENKPRLRTTSFVTEKMVMY